MDTTEGTERRLSREELLRLGIAAGGATLLAGPGGASRVPADWGFGAILYRSDKVKPKARSWGLLFDERYKGKIAWFDDLEMITVAGLYLGFKNPWNQSDAQLKQSQNFLKSKKHLVRLIW